MDSGMLLIFHLGGLMYGGDRYGVRKGFARAYRLKDLPSPKELIDPGKMAAVSDRRSLVLWRALELEE